MKTQLYGIEIDYARDARLDDFSKALLKQFYMKDYESSPQEAFARAAVAYCAGDLALAQRIYDYASKGWFMFSTPILANAPKPGDKWVGLPISCFAAGTPVLTKTGYKEIQDIQVGDTVLSHTGQLQPVKGTKRSLSSDTYLVKVNRRGTPLKVTGNHLLLTNEGWVRVDQLDRSIHLVACTDKVILPTRDHTIRLTNPPTTKWTQFKRDPINTRVPVTTDLAWALGFWFAEGSTSNNGTVKVTNADETLCRNWTQIMVSSFFENEKHTAVNGYGQNWMDGEVYSKTLQEWFDDEFGVGAKEKTLPEWIIDLPKAHLEMFWQGVYEGDGKKTTTNQIIELANPQLIAGLSRILNKLGVKHSLQLRKVLDPNTLSPGTVNGIITVNRTTTSSRRKNSLVRGIRFHDGLEYNQIEEITYLGEEMEVYDIEVEGDHSFSAGGVIAHNCFVTYVPDTLKGLTEHSTEVRWLSVKGGGVGAYWGAVRGVTPKSPGPIPFLKTEDSDMLAYQQTNVRRGSYAAYMDISHPDIVEFINIRTPSGGDPGRKCFNLHHAVCIPDAFMELLAVDGMWDLVDPHTKEVMDRIPARKLWQTIMETRVRTGEPYLFFVDTANRALPQPLKDKGLYIHSSQLCNEIMLPTNEERTAVCCLLSVVCDYFDEWKNTTMVRDLIRFLDNVLQVFIDMAPPELSKAVYSATRERSLGLGAMGFHSYLQSLGIPFESFLAKMVNLQIFQHLSSEAEASSRQLALERGEYPDGVGSGLRNAHRLAIAPNANSAIIACVSASVETIKSNAFTHRTRAGSYLVKNKNLEKLLESQGHNTDEVWSSIINNQGSVQHLDFLTDDVKAIYKTAFEIDQEWIIEHAGDRQPYICQGQSINLFFPAGTDRAYLNKVHLKAWKAGLKGLYYLRSSTGVTADKVGLQVKRTPLADYVSSSESECMSCQA